MFVSFSGLLGRLKGRKDHIFMVDEFLRHYAMAKKAHQEGDKKTLDEFFNLYI